jgi:hypothetical protein
MMIDKLRNGGGRAFREAEANRGQVGRRANYDAQADLALPTADEGRAADAFAPFAGEIVPESTDAGYDVTRDVGLANADIVPPKKRWFRRS